MTHTDNVIDLFRFFLSKPSWPPVPLDEIHTAFPRFNIIELRATLIHMVACGFLKSSPDEKSYTRDTPFRWHKITPLIAGSPEYIVESPAERLICWAQSELDARVITTALNKEPT